MCKLGEALNANNVTQIFQVNLRTCIKLTLAPTQPAGPYHYISSKNRQQISRLPNRIKKYQSFLSYALHHYQ